ncbi:hypothetical protein QNI19_20195 [Cytophagaceae bacterium DM2B3-1]|uniref:Type VI secretion system contractile sheath small subunit n=2 Tax=Xanthocytophaga TaxID=3078918 RepID=A0AAE3QZR4_9BACT|nr:MULTISPECIES: hypothetical protein [Xanthocytophaga]MDJ1467195.1 hypothetical protein [Xanthocytophaga flavus]MDJ1486115.1 hypothetical protein [Xanthocytophaga flavus]MDJ1495272.1 hypothetical protein [Xanthocytophaga flavus]MDJ1503004.1 hypothetical protein [Xanthocytophaga agilis]
MFDYGIGGQERKINVSEGITDIPQNRTLLVEKLTDEPPIQPEIVYDLKNVTDVFEHFQPEKEVEFTDEQGSTFTETLRFRSVADFGKQGLLSQSEFLQNLNLQFEDFQKYVRQLKSNKILKTLLENPEAKAAYLAALQQAIKELEEGE